MHRCRLELCARGMRRGADDVRLISVLPPSLLMLLSWSFRAHSQLLGSCGGTIDNPCICDEVCADQLDSFNRKCVGASRGSRARWYLKSHV